MVSTSLGDYTSYSTTSFEYRGLQRSCRRITTLLQRQHDRTEQDRSILDIIVIYKFRFILQDIYRQLNDLCQAQQSKRAQGKAHMTRLLSSKEFQKFIELRFDLK